MFKSEELIIRDVKNEDYELLKKFNPNIEIPSIESPLTLIHGTIEHENQVLGAGFITIVSEATIVVNPLLEKRDKALVLKELYREAMFRLRDKGLDKLIALTDNELYAKTLEKRFSFQIEKGKVCLKLILE